MGHVSFRESRYKSSTLGAGGSGESFIWLKLKKKKTKKREKVGLVAKQRGGPPTEAEETLANSQIENVKPSWVTENQRPSTWVFFLWDALGAFRSFMTSN